MISQSELQSFLNQELKPNAFKDYCPNGLQVSGRKHIQHLVAGVTASKALIQQAVARQADAILVHHGIYWKGDDPCLVGPHKERVQLLLQNDINLYAYHLPLDTHAVWGNNVQLAKHCAWSVDASLECAGVSGLLWQGHMSVPIVPEQFAQQLETRLSRRPLWIAGTEGDIKHLAWCTGAAQKFLPQAAALGVDAYVTGEASESSYHLALEYGIHFFAAGHHATERYGVMALAQVLKGRFGLETSYVELDNPV